MKYVKIDDRLAMVLESWTNLRATKSFAGLNLEEFKAAIKPSLDAREAVTVADNNYTAAIVLRDNADVAARRIVNRVVAAVVADKDEGDNGELYKAMGYVRRSERNSGLTRSKSKGKKEAAPLAA